MTQIRRKYSRTEYTADPEELLRLAREVEPKKQPMHSLQPYARAAEVLRRKGYKWVDIQKWFAERGVDVHQTALATAVRKWGQTDDYIEFCKEEDKDSELDTIGP